MNTSSNTTTGDRQGNDRFMIYTICFSVVIIAINGIVIVLFLRKKELKQSIPNIFLFSLAVSDFLYAAAAMPTSILCNIYFGPSCRITYFFQVATSFSTIYHLLLGISEKYYAICYTLKHRSTCTVSKARKVSAGVWVVTVVLAHVPLWWSAIFKKLHSNIMYHFGFSMFLFVAVFVVPLLASAFMYVAMLREVKTQSSKMARIRNRGFSPSRKVFLEHQHKCALIFAVMFTVFVLCWSSWFFVRGFYPYIVVNSTAVRETVMVCRYMAAVINPLLYTFVKKDFRRAFVSMFTVKRCQDRRKRETQSTDTKHSMRANSHRQQQTLL